MLWQLKKLSTNQALSEAGELPENWGPIFGLEGIQERLGDLSWLGENYSDMGWVQVEGELPSNEELKAAEVDKEAKQRIDESNWAVSSDAPVTIEQREKWLAYRKKLFDIKVDPQYPNNVTWPHMPE